MRARHRRRTTDNSRAQSKLAARARGCATIISCWTSCERQSPLLSFVMREACGCEVWERGSCILYKSCGISTKWVCERKSEKKKIAFARRRRLYVKFCSDRPCCSLKFAARAAAAPRSASAIMAAESARAKICMRTSSGVCTLARRALDCPLWYTLSAARSRAKGRASAAAYKRARRSQHRAAAAHSVCRFLACSPLRISAIIAAALILCACASLLLFELYHRIVRLWKSRCFEAARADF